MKEPHLRSSNLNFFSPTIGVRFSSRRRPSGCWRSPDRRISSETNAIVAVESKRSTEDAMDEFIGMLDDHMVWYRDKRIKMKFGMSIMGQRRRLGLTA